MARICIASCFLTLDDHVTAMWGRIGEYLARRDHQLLLLTPAEPSGLEFAAVQVPFELRGFTDLVGERPVTERLTPEDWILVERDRLWCGDSSGYSTGQAERGFQACRYFFSELVRCVQPVAGLVWGDGLPQSLLLRRVFQQQGVPSFVVERGLLPDTLMLESEGTGVDSDLNGDPELAAAVMKSTDLGDLVGKARYFAGSKIAKYAPTSRDSAEDLRTRLRLKGKRVLSFFGQHDPASGLVPRDAAATRRSPAFTSVSNALTALVEASVSDENLVVLFKPHPADPTDYRALVGSEQVQIVSGVPSQALFEVSDVIAAMTSTVQFEALWYGKPLLLLARSQLSGKGIAYEVEHQSDLANTLRRALVRASFDTRLMNAQRFLNGITERFLIGVQDVTPTRMHLEDLSQFIADVGQGQGEGPRLESALNQLTAPTRDEPRIQVAQSASTPEVAVIIPVFNQPEYVQRCLEKLFATAAEGSLEVIAVDNASDAPTREVLEVATGRFAHLRVIRNQENRLFAAACNQGAAAARAGVLVFLNSDTEVQSGWLEAGLARLDSDERVGVVGARLLYPDGTIQHGGISFLESEQGGYDIWPEHRFRYRDADDPAANRARTVAAVTGACMFVRSDVFKQLGGFDEDYGMYFEDSDLCMQAHAQGLEVWYEPKICIVHAEGASTGDVREIDRLTQAASQRFFERWGDLARTLVEPEDWVTEPPRDLVAYGERVLSRGAEALAWCSFERALELNPRHPTAHNDLAVLYWQRGDSARALRHLASGLQSAPRDPDLMRNLIAVLDAAGEEHLARKIQVQLSNTGVFSHAEGV